jgi:hypothetical protein
MLLMSFNAFLLVFLTILKQCFCSGDDNILVKSANLHICSELLDQCSKITEFFVKNIESNTKANNKAYVKILFKAKNLNTDTTKGVYGYLAPYGALFGNDTSQEDTRRTKT